MPVVVGCGLRAQICVPGQTSPRLCGYTTSHTRCLLPLPRILPHIRRNVVTFASNTTQIQTAIFNRCRETFLSLSHRDSFILETLRRQRNVVIKDADRRQKCEGCWEEEGGGDVTRVENERRRKENRKWERQEWSMCRKRDTEYNSHCFLHSP